MILPARVPARLALPALAIYVVWAALELLELVPISGSQNQPISGIKDKVDIKSNQKKNPSQ